MDPPISAEPGTNFAFERVVEELASKVSRSEAEALAREYYVKFTSPAFCKELGIPTQDDEFFQHQGAADMTLRIYYYLVLKSDPNPSRYIEWRRKFYQQRSQTQAH